MAADLIALPACACGKAGKTTRLPTGWHRRADEVFCGDCWKKHYVLRALTFRIASVDCGWKPWDAATREAFGVATAMSNWAVAQLYVRDVHRTGASGEKLPPMARVYLYPDARALWPSLPPQSVVSLLSSVERKYRARRLDMWLGKQSLPTYRWPTPVPVHNASWSAATVDERATVSVRIAGERHTLILATGSGRRSIVESFRQIAFGVAVRGELALLPENRIKLVAWLPRPELNGVRRRSGVLSIATRPDCLLLADTGWRLNGDHVRRWAGEHARTIQRLAEDQKSEQRPTPSFAGFRARAAAKYRRRMDSATHEIAAAVAGYAERKRFSRVLYADAETKFCPTFPYEELRRKLAYKLDAAGIEFERASAEAAQKLAEALAQEKQQ